MKQKNDDALGIAFAIMSSSTFILFMICILIFGGM